MTIISIESDFVLRNVSSILSIDKYKELLGIIDNCEILKNHIIETQIQSVNPPVLKHRKIKHVIHSSEFTDSMAYDVTSTAINMSLCFLNYGIYANDLLAHNYAFENGKWILYDFCSFSYNQKGLKTQIRNMFYISFAAFELLKVIERKKLKHYFLNRIKYSRLIKMILFQNWIKWFLNMEFIIFLAALNKPKTALDYMQKIFEKYNKQHIRKIYEPFIEDENKNLYDIIDNLISKTSDVFCIGKFSGDWALYSKTSASKFFYTDDYELCDNYYNTVIKNEIKNIAAAVLQPLIKDEMLKDDLKYRALYDDFTKQRLISDTVLIDFNEVYDERYETPEEFCQVISDYAKQCMIIKLEKDKILLDKIQSEMKKYFEYTDYTETNKYYVLFEKNNIYSVKSETLKYYGNDNRAKEQKQQCRAIIDLIKNR